MILTNYNMEKLLHLLKHFECLTIIPSLLKSEVQRAKRDVSLGLPISRKGAENLLKLQNAKNTISTSTSTVERAFSAMNRISREIGGFNDNFFEPRYCTSSEHGPSCL